MRKWHHIENQPLLRETYKEKPIISDKKGKSGAFAIIPDSPGDKEITEIHLVPFPNPKKQKVPIEWILKRPSHASHPNSRFAHLYPSNCLAGRLSNLDLLYKEATTYVESTAAPTEENDYSQSQFFKHALTSLLLSAKNLRWEWLPRMFIDFDIKFIFVLLCLAPRRCASSWAATAPHDSSFCCAFRNGLLERNAEETICLPLLEAAAHTTPLVPPKNLYSPTTTGGIR